MHFKQKRRFIAALLACAAATLVASFPRQQAPPRPRPRRGQNPNREGLARFVHLDSPPDMDETSSAASAEARSGARSHGKERPSTREGVRVAPSPPAEGCVGGDMELATLGRFYISGRLEVNSPKGDDLPADDAAAAAASRQNRVKGQIHRGLEKVWERLQPLVKCHDHSMTLTVRRRGVGQLLLHPVNDSPVPLSQLPPQCGYSLHTTWRDLTLMARYSACHVTLEGDSYVLPLLWRGSPVKVSCPASQAELQSSDPPTICCAPYSATVKLRGIAAVEELRLNVRGEWTPLVTLAEQCGYTIETHDVDIVITAPLITCGITVQDGKYSFSLQMGENLFTLVCPVTPFEEHSPAGKPPGEEDDKQSDPLGVFSWTPPFYLAPLNYPHPVYRRKYLGQSVDNLYSPPMAASSAPQSTSGPPLFPDYSSQTGDQVPKQESHRCSGVHSSPAPERKMEDLIQLHPDQHQSPDNPALAFSEGKITSHSFSFNTDVPVQAEGPLQPLTNAFSQYYHYYHNPKIPLSDSPQQPNPPIEAFYQTNPHLPQSAAWLQSTHQSGGQTTAYSSHFSEDPYFSRDEAKKLALRISETIPKPHFPVVPDIVKLTDSDLSDSADIHLKNNLPSFGSQPFLDETNGPELSQSLASAVVGAKAEEKPSRLDTVVDQPPAFPNLSPSHHLPDSLHYLLYYPHPQQYDPGSFLAADSLFSTSPSDPSNLRTQRLSGSLLQDSSFEKAQATAVPTEPVHDVLQGPLVPYLYHYHDHYTSEANKEKRETNPAAPADSKSDSSEHHVQSQAAASGSTPPSDGSEEHEVNERALKGIAGWQQFFRVPHYLQNTKPPARPPEASNVSCMLHKLISDPNVYVVSLCGCGRQYLAVRLLEGPVANSLRVVDSVSENPVKMMADCSSTGSLKETSLSVTPPSHLHSSASAATVQLRIATDESFGSFHPEAHLPLSLIQGRPVYLEVSLPKPPEPDLVLLVQSCIAYTETHWRPVFDGCSNRGESWLLPSSHSDHIRRIVVSSFLSLPSDSPPTMAKGGLAHLEDPEIFFLCLTEVCSTAAGKCTQRCINGPITVIWSMK